MHPNVVNYLGHVYIQYMPKLLEKEYETKLCLLKFKNILSAHFSCCFFSRINSIFWFVRTIGTNQLFLKL
jgi:hypothetical protein